MVSDTIHKRNATYCVAVDLQTVDSYLGPKFNHRICTSEVLEASVDTCGRIQRAYHAILHTSPAARKQTFEYACLGRRSTGAHS